MTIILLKPAIIAVVGALFAFHPKEPLATLGKYCFLAGMIGVALSR